MKSGLLLLTIIIVAFSSAASPQQVDADILQVKLNRLYLSQGSEAGVFIGTPFTISCGGDSVYSGIIEFAGEGISYSQPSAVIEAVAIDTTCSARLTIASVDSTAEIRLGTDLPLELFDPEHETLFLRAKDTVLPLLADSTKISGREMIIYLNPDVRFSDGYRLNSDIIVSWLKDLQYRSRSYPVRYFFARLLPIDDGGVTTIDAFTIKFTFYQNMPRAAYLLSHPDFGVYDEGFNGTGPLIEVGYASPGENMTAFVPNRNYRGARPAFSKIIIKHFAQPFRMKFEYENKQLQGYFGLGFDEDLAGRYGARALYPYIAALIPGMAQPSYNDGMFPTSLYYRFDSNRAHLIFPNGKISEIHRWGVFPDSLNNRYYPFDFLKGKALHQSIGASFTTINLVYDDGLLYETAQYVADIAAREGCRTLLDQYTIGKPYDVRLAFFPASDDVTPFALISAVLELNYQNSTLPSNKKKDNPGWANLGQGSTMFDIDNRNRLFYRADNEVIEGGNFFPLFRPWVFGVGSKQMAGLAFDFYGYPDLSKIAVFTSSGGGNR